MSVPSPSTPGSQPTKPSSPLQCDSAPASDITASVTSYPSNDAAPPTANPPADESAKPAGAQPPVKVTAKLQEAFHRVQHAETALLVWEKVLTEEERAPLGRDFQSCWKKYRGTVQIWMAVYKVSQARAIIELARKTDQMSEMDYRWLDGEISKVDPMLPPAKRRAKRPRTDREDPEERLLEAISSHQLVLVRGNGRHLAYWKRKKIQAGWDPCARIWELFWQLAESAHRTGGEVSWDQLTDCQNEKQIIHRRSRLKKMIPVDLNDLIKPGSEPRTYKLKMDANQIELIELELGEWLMERNEI
jgi:hypothetical protein